MTDRPSNRKSSAFTAASVPEHYERRLAPFVFEPWAEILLSAVGLRPGDHVLDVASGTGVVARAAARRVRADGWVVASDVSAPMLARAAAEPTPAGAAAIEYREASATALPFDAASFDVVVCQQGLQFFPDPASAVGEVRRVLRAGGVAGVAVWAAGHRLHPFDDYSEALISAGVEPPFPRAFENASFVMDPEVVRRLFHDAGLADVEVTVVEHTVAWVDATSAAAGILGTPFGPVVESLSAARRRKLESALAERFAPEAPGQPVRRSTVAVIAQGRAPGEAER